MFVLVRVSCGPSALFPYNYFRKDSCAVSGECHSFSDGPFIAHLTAFAGTFVDSCLDCVALATNPVMSRCTWGYSACYSELTELNRASCVSVASDGLRRQVTFRCPDSYPRRRLGNPSQLGVPARLPGPCARAEWLDGWRWRWHADNKHVQTPQPVHTSSSYVLLAVILVVALQGTSQTLPLDTSYALFFVSTVTPPNSSVVPWTCSFADQPTLCHLFCT